MAVGAACSSTPTTPTPDASIDVFAADVPVADVAPEAAVDAADVVTADAPKDSPTSNGCTQTIDSHTLALWHFDEGSGLVAHDSSGNGHDGLFGGSSTANSADPQWGTGVSKGDVVFTSSDAGDVGEYVQSSTASAFTAGQGSLEMWILQSPPYNYAQPFAAGDNICFRLQLDPNGALEGLLGDGSNWHPATTASGFLQDGNWHYVALTFDGTTPKVYVDAVMQASGSASVTPPVPNDYYLGGRPSNTFLNGQLDEVRVSDIARTQSEISATFAACTPP